MQMSQQSSFASIPYSACVDRARRGLHFRPDIEKDIPLRAIAFATRWGSESEGWYGLKDTMSGSAAGEVFYCRTCSKTDPVRFYVCARLASGLVLECVEFASLPRITQFFACGRVLGRMVEEQLPREKSLWPRILGGRRAWEVFLYEVMIGRIEYAYPLSKHSRLLMQLSTGISLPIGLANVWFRKSTKYVIPPDAPVLGDQHLEVLYFWLNITFRILFQLDFSAS